MVERKEVARLPQTITISTGTIFRAILILLVLGFLYLIRDVLAMLFAALFLAALMDPFADFLERWKIPRGLAALIVYICALAILALVVILILPPVMNELQNFFSYFSPYIQAVTGGEVNYQNLFSSGSFTHTLEDALATVKGSGVSEALPQLLEIGSMAFGGLAAAVVVFILAFFFVAEKTALVRAVSVVAPAEYQPFVLQLSIKLRERLGAWLRGELLLMLSIFILTYVALTLLQIPNALLLSLIAGLLEVLPFIGPWLAAVPAVILALAVSPLHALITAGTYLLIQMIEGNILVPKIMQKVTGVNPIISLLAVLIGWRVGGVVGVVLSIPIAMAGSVFLGEIFRNRTNQA